MTKRKIEPFDTHPSGVANALNASLDKIRLVHSPATHSNLARRFQEKIQQTTTPLSEAILLVHNSWWTFYSCQNRSGSRRTDRTDIKNSENDDHVMCGSLEFTFTPMAR
jgi:hypothetical protein